MDENSIMGQVAGGDLGKMGILYEKYKRPLYGYFFKLTSGNYDASEDLVHSVFFRAIKYRNSFRGAGSFAKWIFTIAHNLGIDYIRKQGRIKTVELETGYQVASNNETDHIERSESLNLLNMALGMMDIEEREILLMGKIRDLKYSEIAEIKGISESAVKTRICRALKRLKDIYLKIETTQYEKERI